MLNIKRCFSNPRLTKALNGVKIKEFHELLESFTLELKRHNPSKKKVGKRKEGAGRNHTHRDSGREAFFHFVLCKMLSHS